MSKLSSIRPHARGDDLSWAFTSAQARLRSAKSIVDLLIEHHLTEDAGEVILAIAELLDGAEEQFQRDARLLDPAHGQEEARQ